MGCCVQLPPDCLPADRADLSGLRCSARRLRAPAHSLRACAEARVLRYASRHEARDVHRATLTVQQPSAVLGHSLHPLNRSCQRRTAWLHEITLLTFTAIVKHLHLLVLFYQSPTNLNSGFVKLLKATLSCRPFWIDLS